MIAKKDLSLARFHRLWRQVNPHRLGGSNVVWVGLYYVLLVVAVAVAFVFLALFLSPVYYCASHCAAARTARDRTSTIKNVELESVTPRAGAIHMPGSQNPLRMPGRPTA